MKRIKGTAQADNISGSAKDELIDALGGDDTLDGGAGDDVLDGGEGDDVLAGGLGSDILLGGEGDDDFRLKLGEGADQIDGGAGLDIAFVDFRAATADVAFDLGKGAQTLFDGTTIDNVEQIYLSTGSGHDRLIGGQLTDRLFGGEGRDVIEGRGGADALNGEGGDDIVVADDRDGMVRGGAGTDLGVFDYRAVAQDLTFDVAANLAGEIQVADGWVSGFERVIIDSGSGADTLTGGALRDEFFSYAGDDALSGGGEADWLDAGAGKDSLLGGAGADTLAGGEGDDWLHAGPAGEADRIDGGNGSDYAVVDRSTAAGRIVLDLAGGSSLDGGATLVNVEQVSFLSGAGNDLLKGGDLADRLFGGGGSDVIHGMGGGDRLSGEGGDDLIVADAQDYLVEGGEGTDSAIFDLQALAYDLKFDLAANLAGQVNLGEAWVSGFERVSIVAGFGNDSLVGGDLHDVFNGNVGDDFLAGGGGDDGLYGDLGNDTLVGGAGADTISGGDGEDLAVFARARSDYQVVQLEDGALRIADLRAPGEGMDLVSGVERFGFADGELTRDQLLGVNRPPVAVGDSATVGEDAGVSIAVLANDTDPEGGAVSLVSVDTSATQGSATINADGTVTYTPGPSFNWLAVGQSSSDSFTYTVRDAGGATSTATVVMQITGANDGPVAVADAAVVGEDGKVTFDLLANDSDPDFGTVLTLGSLNFTGSKGRAEINPDGTVTYDPGTAFQHLAAGETATDVIAYSVRDGNGGLAMSSVTITVQGADEPDPPPPPPPPSGAQDDSLAFASNQGVAVIRGLTVNDVGEGLRITSVSSSSAANARVYVQDGEVIYDPGDLFAGLAAGQTATDSFTYTVTDASGATSTATARVTVAGAGDADVYRYVGEDEASGNLYADVLAAATERFGDGVTLTSIDAATTVGQVAFDRAGEALTYTADHPWLDRLWGDQIPPQTSFRYTVTDAAGQPHVGTVVLVVEPRADAPIAQADELRQDAGTLSGDLWNVLLGNDFDLDGGDTLRIVSVDDGGALGEVLFDPLARTLHYRAAEGASGEDSFSYTVRDSSGLESTAIVTVELGSFGAAGAFV